MSMLPADVHTELTQLLQALQSSDNSIRSQAEDHLHNNWTATRPEILLMGLAEQIQNTADVSVRRIVVISLVGFSYGSCCSDNDIQIRSFAAVIFRRIASKSRKNDKGEAVDIFVSLPKDQAAVIRQKLLEILTSETERGVRNKISDAVAEVARQFMESSGLTLPAEASRSHTHAYVV